MQLSRSEFLMQQQSSNSDNVSLSGQVNNSGEIKISHCINTAAWAVNRRDEKEANLNPKGINSALSGRCAATYLLQLAAPGRWKGPSAPARQSSRNFHLLSGPSRSRSCSCFFPAWVTRHGSIHRLHRKLALTVSGERADARPGYYWVTEKHPGETSLSIYGAYAQGFVLTFLNLLSLRESHPCRNGNFWPKLKHTLKSPNQMRTINWIAKCCVRWKWQMHRWQERQNVYRSDDLENYDIYTWWMRKEGGCNDTSVFLTAHPFSFLFLFFSQWENAFTENRNCFPLMLESRRLSSQGAAQPSPLILVWFTAIQTCNQFLIWTSNTRVSSIYSLTHWPSFPCSSVVSSKVLLLCGINFLLNELAGLMTSSES